jgi:hypothetical protein
MNVIVHIEVLDFKHKKAIVRIQYGSFLALATVCMRVCI